MLTQLGRARDERLQRWILAVENAQRVALEAPPAVLIELALVLAEIFRQLSTIAAARLGRAERIDLEAHARDPQAAPQARGERDELRIDIGTRKADRLHIDLVELSIAALLRFLVAEHRPDAPELVTRTAQQAVGDERATDAGGRL